MPSPLPNAWARALKATSPEAAARALCSVSGWQTHVDANGRNVWMFTLAHQLGGTWPLLASREGAWKSFSQPDVQGRTILDYLFAYGPPSARRGGWLDEALTRVEALGGLTHHLAARLLEVPLPVQPGLRLPGLKEVSAWSSRLPPTLWGWEHVADDERWPWMVQQDVKDKGRLWWWVRPHAPYLEKVLPTQRRWVFMTWGGAMCHPWEPQQLTEGLGKRVVRPSDQQPLKGCAMAWANWLGKPEVQSLVLDLSLDQANKSGRRSARL